MCLYRHERALLWMSVYISVARHLTSFRNSLSVCVREYIAIRTLVSSSRVFVPVCCKQLCYRFVCATTTAHISTKTHYSSSHCKNNSTEQHIPTYICDEHETRLRTHCAIIYILHYIWSNQIQTQWGIFLSHTYSDENWKKNWIRKYCSVSSKFPFTSRNRKAIKALNCLRWSTKTIATWMFLSLYELIHRFVIVWNRIVFYRPSFNDFWISSTIFVVIVCSVITRINARDYEWLCLLCASKRNWMK